MWDHDDDLMLDVKDDPDLYVNDVVNKNGDDDDARAGNLQS